MTLAIKSLGLIEVICDNPYIRVKCIENARHIHRVRLEL